MNKNYLQDLINSYEQTKELLFKLIKELSFYYKTNSFKDKIESSVRIKKLEEAVFYNMYIFKIIIIKNKNNKNFDEEYIAQLVSVLQQSVAKVNSFKTKVFSAKHKSAFLKRLNKNKNTAADEESESLALF